MWPMKENIHKMHFKKSENVCSVKDTVERMERKGTNWEAIISQHISDKEHIQNMQRCLNTQESKQAK